MARRRDGNVEMGLASTDHSEEIARLRERAKQFEVRDQLVYLVAAELLLAHDETWISLDDWHAPRRLVELLVGDSILENCVDV